MAASDGRSSSDKVTHVLAIVAMEAEAMPIVERFQLERIEPSPFLAGLPAVAWSGLVCTTNMRLNVVWCGKDERYAVNNVGTTAASVSAYAAVSAFGRPDICLSVGTAGGFGSRGACVGDVFLSTKCVFHARRIPDGSTRGTLEEFGFGHYRSPMALVNKIARVAGIKAGVITTSDSLDTTERDLEIMAAEGAAVKEMEAASVAWTCQQLGVPFFALKSITDIVDSVEMTTREEFDANLSTAAAALQEKLALVLQTIGGELLSELASARL